jgi:hypothetical protein
MFVRQRLMFLLEKLKDEVLCAFYNTLLMCTSQERVLWMSKQRYVAELTLFSTCPWMVYLDCSGVLVIFKNLHLSGRSCICHWYFHSCNVSRYCCWVLQSSSGPILRYKLIIYCFTSRARIFHLYGDVLSREGSLSCHTCCDTGPRFFLVSFQGPSHSVAS